jgi:hypothetical protein
MMAKNVSIMIKHYINKHKSDWNISLTFFWNSSGTPLGKPSLIESAPNKIEDISSTAE